MDTWLNSLLGVRGHVPASLRRPHSALALVLGAVLLAACGQQQAPEGALREAPNHTVTAQADMCQHIAFTSERDGDREIYVMNADGTNQTNLTNHPGDDFEPSFGMCKNTAPVAVDDTFTTDKNITLEGNVLTNDTDAEGNPLRVVEVVDGTDNGRLNTGENGGFIYIPNPGFSGEDSFTYKATDGRADSNIATVRIPCRRAMPPPSLLTTSTPRTRTPHSPATSSPTTPTPRAAP